MATDPIELISAVAAGDAERDDVLRALEDEGIDSLELLVDVLTAATRKRETPVQLSVLDPQRASREPVESIHQVPHLPFLLNGTLYDPSDIKRFDGQELHLIGGSDTQPIMAIDDREIFDRWSQFSYISTATSQGQGGGGFQASDFGSGLGGGGIGLGDGPLGPSPSPGLSGPPRAIFWEHIHYGGSDIECPRNQGYWDLTRVAFTFLGTGHWNDTISSIQTSIPLWTRLWEHIRWTGSSYTVFGGSLNLAAVGWNDRASSTETW